MGLICRDFAIIYVLALIGLMVIALALEQMTGTDVGSAVNIVPQIVAAMLSGQRHGKRAGVRPNSGFAWKAAFLMTMISVGLSILFAIVLIGLAGPADTDPLMNFLRTQVVVIVLVSLVIIVLYLLVSRYFFGLGAKQGAAKSPQVDDEVFR